MQVGLHALGIGAGARRHIIDAVAVAAESGGFATLWSGEHVVMVDRSSSRYPYSADGQIAVPPTADWNDPMIGLSFAAAASSTIGLATGVLLLPEHNPVVVAKQAATLDVLSGGRLALGVGIGWSRDEFDALGVPFSRRGAHRRVRRGHPHLVARGRRVLRRRVRAFRVGARQSQACPRQESSDRARRQHRRGAASCRRVGRRLVRIQPGECGRRRRTPRLPRSAVSGVWTGHHPAAPLRLRQPQISEVPALADLGVDELVIVESPPADPRLVVEWVSTLADRFLAAVP